MPGKKIKPTPKRKSSNYKPPLQARGPQDNPAKERQRQRAIQRDELENRRRENREKEEERGQRNNANSPLQKKDACYAKVKARYKKWPSAYASGALVKCRKVGAKNWGNKSK